MKIVLFLKRLLNKKIYVPSAIKGNLEFLVLKKIVFFNKFFGIFLLAHLTKDVNNMFFVIDGDLN